MACKPLFKICCSRLEAQPYKKKKKAKPKEHFAKPLPSIFYTKEYEYY